MVYTGSKWYKYKPSFKLTVFVEVHNCKNVLCVSTAATVTFCLKKVIVKQTQMGLY